MSIIKSYNLGREDELDIHENAIKGVVILDGIYTLSAVPSTNYGVSIQRKTLNQNGSIDVIIL